MKKYFSIVLLFFISAISAFSQTGALDLSFNSGGGSNSSVTSIIPLSDGKMLIGGTFTSYNGTPAGYIARLNADGSLDTTFNYGGTGANNNVDEIVILPSGKILIAGAFSTYNGLPAPRITRLNADGSMDAGFNPGTGPAGGPGFYAMAVQNASLTSLIFFL